MKNLRIPPVKEGEEIDVVIEAVGKKGDGIAKKDGFVIIVPNAKEGDRVRVKMTKVLLKVGFAEIIGKADEQKQEKSKEETSEEISENFGEELEENKE